jgi:hypothetical protein
MVSTPGWVSVSSSIRQARTRPRDSARTVRTLRGRTSLVVFFQSFLFDKGLNSKMGDALSSRQHLPLNTCRQTRCHPLAVNGNAQMTQDGNLIKQRSSCLADSLAAAPWFSRHGSCTCARHLGSGSPHRQNGVHLVDPWAAFTCQHHQLLTLSKAASFACVGTRKS